MFSLAAVRAKFDGASASTKSLVEGGHPYSIRVDEVVYAFEHQLESIKVAPPKVQSEIVVHIGDSAVETLKAESSPTEVLLVLGAVGDGNDFVANNLGVIRADGQFAAISDDLVRALSLQPELGSRYQDVATALQPLAAQREKELDGALQADRKIGDIVQASIESLAGLDIEFAPTEPPRPGGSVAFAVRTKPSSIVVWAQCLFDDRSATIAKMCTQPATVDGVRTDDLWVGTVAVPPNLQVASRADVADCARHLCGIVVIDLATGLGTAIASEGTPLKLGPGGEPPTSPDVKVPAQTAELSATMTSYSLPDGSAVVLELTDVVQSAYFASLCQGPRGDAKGCSSLVRLSPSTDKLYVGVMTVPSSCTDDCRVAIFDSADLGRRTVLSLK